LRVRLSLPYQLRWLKLDELKDDDKAGAVQYQVTMPKNCLPIVATHPVQEILQESYRVE
jgi:hypothetical protein